MYLSLRERPHNCVSFMLPELHRKGRRNTSHSIGFFFLKGPSPREHKKFSLASRTTTETITQPSGLLFHLSHPISNTLPQICAKRCGLEDTELPKCPRITNFWYSITKHLSGTQHLIPLLLLPVSRSRQAQHRHQIWEIIAAPSVDHEVSFLGTCPLQHCPFPHTAVHKELSSAEPAGKSNHCIEMSTRKKYNQQTPKLFLVCKLHLHFPFW